MNRLLEAFRWWADTKRKCDDATVRGTTSVEDRSAVAMAEEELALALELYIDDRIQVAIVHDACTEVEANARLIAAAPALLAACKAAEKVFVAVGKIAQDTGDARLWNLVCPDELRAAIDLTKPPSTRQKRRVR